MTKLTSLTWIVAFLLAVSPITALGQPPASQGSAKLGQTRDRPWTGLLTAKDKIELSTGMDRETKRLRERYEASVRNGPGGVQAFKEEILEAESNLPGRIADLQRDLGDPGHVGARTFWLYWIAQYEAYESIKPVVASYKFEATPNSIVSNPTAKVSKPAPKVAAAPPRVTPPVDVDWRKYLTSEETKSLPGLIDREKIRFEKSLYFANRRSSKPQGRWMSDFFDRDLKIQTSFVSHRTKRLESRPNNAILRRQWLDAIAKREALLALKREAGK